MQSEDALRGGWVIPGEDEVSPEPGIAPLWETMLNRLALALIWVPFLAGVLLLLGALLRLAPGLGSVSLSALGTALVSNLLLVLAERPAVVRARNSRPGGWGYAVWIFVLPPVVGLLVGWVLAPGLALASALAAALVFGATGWVTKPWRRHLRRADYQANWQETRRWLQGNRR